jgi:hypothetical protein
VSKHTPGPWTTENIFEEDNGPTLDICIGYDVPGAGSPVMLASCFYDDGSPISKGQATANAKLIAAAPCLLEECRIAIIWYRTMLIGCPEDAIAEGLRSRVETSTEIYLRAGGDPSKLPSEAFK